MINSCAEKVAAGGALTYSTCSITVEENEMIIERFLKVHPEFSLAEIEPKIGLPGMRDLTQVPTTLSAHSPMQRLLHSKTAKTIIATHSVEPKSPSVL